jgi:hypothetical protein
MNGMITAVTRCDSCGEFGRLRFALAGQHFATRLGVDCQFCDGMAFTVGRYGASEADGELLTVLTRATQDELAQIAADPRPLAEAACRCTG